MSNPSEQPAAPLSPMAGSVTRDDFREAMSRLGAAVHIITTAGDAGECGLTASAVCSVTDTPPTVLVCLNRSSETNKVFKHNSVFCINTLTSDQQNLSNSFAGFKGQTMAERFAEAEWEYLQTGAPALKSALVTLDCTVTSVAEVGTHSVLFGEIQKIRFGDSRPALMYFKRSYRRLEDTTPG